MWCVFLVCFFFEHLNGLCNETITSTMVRFIYWWKNYQLHSKSQKNQQKLFFLINREKKNTHREDTRIYKQQTPWQTSQSILHVLHVAGRHRNKINCLSLKTVSNSNESQWTEQWTAWTRVTLKRKVCIKENLHKTTLVHVCWRLRSFCSWCTRHYINVHDPTHIVVVIWKRIGEGQTTDIGALVTFPPLI